MRAMVLAAGLGLRMLPLTLAISKPAIPVLGRPLLERILCRLGRHGVVRAVVNVHHRPGDIERLVAGVADPGFPGTIVSHEPVILGTGGGLRNAAADLRGEGPILVHNGDFLSDIDFGRLVARHRDSGKLATLVLAPARPGFGAIEVDGEGTVLSLSGRPRAPKERVRATLTFTGCHLVDEAVLDEIPADRPSCIVSDVYRRLAARGLVGSMLHEGFWWEFGEPELYLEGSLELLRVPDALRAEVLAETAPPEEGEVEAGASVLGRAFVGTRARIESPAVVEDSVILERARVGSGSRLARVVVGPGATIPAGSEWKDALVCLRPEELPAGLPDSIRIEGDLLVRRFR